MMQARPARLFASLPMAVLASGLLAYYIEFLAKSDAGTVLSVGVAVCLIATSTVSLKHGIVLAWVAAVLVPEFPRDILDVYEALEARSSVEQYNVLSSVNVGPASLILLVLLFNTALVLITRLRTLRVGRGKVIAVMAVALTGTVGLLYGGFDRSHLEHASSLPNRDGLEQAVEHDRPKVLRAARPTARVAALA